MANKREVRYIKAEFRAVTEPDKPTKLVGYAAMFDMPSEDLGGFREVIRKGAFTRAISEGQDVRALFNHDPNMVMGRSKSGTLSLMEDEQGLKIECDMPDTAAARDLMTLVQRGDVDQMSFGFYVRGQNWMEGQGAMDEMAAMGCPMEDPEDAVLREITDVDLFDVSAVTYPAYPQTSVEARSLWPEGVPEEITHLGKSAIAVLAEELQTLLLKSHLKMRE